MVAFWRGATLPRGPSRVHRLRQSEKAMGNKYGAKRAACGDHWHPSLAERARCFVLHQRARLGEIRDLRLHTSWPLKVNGVEVGKYTDDASYYLPDGTFVVEDCKSAATRRETAYRLRRKLFRAVYGFDITEVE
jgi:hypothetical protein